MPLLSIVVPVYNEESTVRDLLLTVLDAPLPEGVEREIVAVNDGSSDGTAEVLATFADEPRVRVFHQPGNRGKVLDSGLWRYTRHPNYFGNFTLWWGFFLLAWSAGAPWTIVAPILMSILLLKVSGVALLEKDIGERRPAYAAYISRTNAFFPGPPRAEP